MLVLVSVNACGTVNISNTFYEYEEYPLWRNGIRLHLDCMQKEGCGRTHVVFIEKPYYHEFQDKLTAFLSESI